MQGWMMQGRSILGSSMNKSAADLNLRRNKRVLVDITNADDGDTHVDDANTTTVFQ
jgi:hypothetical protein